MLLLTGALLLPCIQCSARSLVYLPPRPKDKTEYLNKRANWEQYRRTFNHNGAKLSGWFIEKKRATSTSILRRKCHGYLHDASLSGSLSSCQTFS